MISDVCTNCGNQVFLEDHTAPTQTWIDNSGGDVCEGDSPHTPHNRSVPHLDEAVLSLRPHLHNLIQSAQSGVPHHLVEAINHLSKSQFGDH